MGDARVEWRPRGSAHHNTVILSRRGRYRGTLCWMGTALHSPEWAVVCACVDQGLRGGTVGTTAGCELLSAEGSGSRMRKSRCEEMESGGVSLRMGMCKFASFLLRPVYSFVKGKLSGPKMPSISTGLESTSNKGPKVGGGCRKLPNQSRSCFP